MEVGGIERRKATEGREAVSGVLEVFPFTYLVRNDLGGKYVGEGRAYLAIGDVWFSTPCGES